jgi:hypothetical protein
MKIKLRFDFLRLQLITILFWNLHLNRNFRLSRWACYVKGDRYFEIDRIFVTVRIYKCQSIYAHISWKFSRSIRCNNTFATENAVWFFYINWNLKKLKRHVSYFSYHELITQSPLYRNLLYYDSSCHFLDTGLGVSH